MSYRTARVGFSIAGLAMLVVLALLPVAGAYQAGPATPSITVGGCSVSVNGVTNSVTYPQSQTFQVTLTATSPSGDCIGVGGYSLVGPSGANGFFSCGPCDGTVAHALVWAGGPLSPGSYTLNIIFLGFPLTFSFQVINFFVAAELPIGAALAVIVPLGALFAFSRVKGITLFR